MPREISSRYDIASTTPHVQLTSTGTGNVQTFTKPGNAIACYVSCATNAARVVFDGTTPSATNGITVPTGALFLFEVGKNINAASTIAGNSVIDVLWLS